jgi:hypothetical protein
MTDLASHSTFDINEGLALRAQKPAVWQQPEMFDLNEADDIAKIELKLAGGDFAAVVDPIESVAHDLFVYHHGPQQNDSEARDKYVGEIQSQGASYGKWFHFPWSNKLVHYPDMADLRDLRTSRNRELVTREEQLQLYAASIAVMGLSVGSNVVERLVTSGIGGELILADPDTLETSNLNRINASYLEVGSRKIDVAARKISEADPYITQVHMVEGVNEINLAELKEHRPSIIVDEIDNLAMKAVIRLFAYKEGIPVIMATDVDDVAPLDVERYDLGTATPFGGRLTESQVTKLAANELSLAELNAVRIGMVGMENVTPRLMESVQKIATGALGGLPQLGTTAAVGGSHVTLGARQIILGRNLPTGRYMDSKSIVNA